MGVGLEPTTGSERADLQSAAVAAVPSHIKSKFLIYDIVTLYCNILTYVSQRSQGTNLRPSSYYAYDELLVLP